MYLVQPCQGTQKQASAVNSSNKIKNVILSIKEIPPSPQTTSINIPEIPSLHDMAALSPILGLKTPLSPAELSQSLQITIPKVPKIEPINNNDESKYEKSHRFFKVLVL